MARLVSLPAAKLAIPFVNRAAASGREQQRGTASNFRFLGVDNWKSTLEAVSDEVLKWAKNHKAMFSTPTGAELFVGMYGDLQGIAGKSLQEIEGLELPTQMDQL
jgi:hypothetical protein